MRPPPGGIHHPEEIVIPDAMHRPAERERWMGRGYQVSLLAFGVAVRMLMTGVVRYCSLTSGSRIARYGGGIRRGSQAGQAVVVKLCRRRSAAVKTRRVCHKNRYSARVRTRRQAMA